MKKKYHLNKKKFAAFIAVVAIWGVAIWMMSWMIPDLINNPQNYITTWR